MVLISVLYFNVFFFRFFFFGIFQIVTQCNWQMEKLLSIDDPYFRSYAVHSNIHTYLKCYLDGNWTQLILIQIVIWLILYWFTTHIEFLLLKCITTKHNVLDWKNSSIMHFFFQNQLFENGNIVLNFMFFFIV